MAFEYIKNNLDGLREELSDISRRVGVAVPTLVAVTKSGTDEELVALARAGITDIGENRPGEVKRRGELLREHGFTPRMHEIGTLQRNKIKLIIETAAMIHSVDSYKLAYDIDRLAEKCGRRIPVLIELNSADEEAKSGVSIDGCERLLNEILPLKNIEISGLMTMGPALDDPEGLRPYFRKTKELFDKLASSYGFGDTPTLSMGMSDSYAVAIEEGSTLVRVGRKLFKK